ncbi:acetyltransferase-like isoleucine patch superfamily enzyme [Povalibacter uvarum]|uniref:Acetyltransferase-like isoleucine patch superfamily enzyme n=1 Tax=Povalibacter uvarum TaxID=732238 RepID=A0A841HH96_9GAMM|nr:acyltransferase [Povalibacter uvarum]MBB6091658.1 acetyltransferase-like isoleucine patch superfamily enzyme [Povalibacter uvarum]
MRKAERISAERYHDIDYHQFTQSRVLRIAMAVTGVLTWPIVLPLVLFSRLSDFIFLTCSQILAFVPYLLGTIVRYEFYRFTLTRCGRNVMIGFGTVFLYRDVSIGDNVLIGMYNTIHYCDFGSYVLTAEGCRFLSGAKYHNYDRTDVPMALQGGKLRRISLADDCWIGTNAVVMAEVATGAIVGAGAVVNSPVESYQIVGGVPAKVIASRKPAQG